MYRHRLERRQTPFHPTARAHRVAKAAAESGRASIPGRQTSVWPRSGGGRGGPGARGVRWPRSWHHRPAVHPLHLV